MESGRVTKELTQRAAAYLTSIAFGASFLVATCKNVDGLTALWRSVIAAGAAFVVAQLLAPPVVDVVLSALARDEAKRQAELPKEGDE